jgi:DNA-binding PadR family transcriptional regulator
MFKAPVKLLMLRALTESSLSGYDLMKSLQSSLGKKPSSGYVYPLLHELQNEGLVTLHNKNRKKMYSLTSKGKNFLSDLESSCTVFIGSMKDRFKKHLDPHELEESIRFHTRMIKYKPQILSNLDLWQEFFDNTFAIYERDYPKKRKELIKILKDTTVKLAALSKER